MPYTGTTIFKVYSQINITNEPSNDATVLYLLLLSLSLWSDDISLFREAAVNNT